MLIVVIFFTSLNELQQFDYSITARFEAILEVANQASIESIIFFMKTDMTRSTEPPIIRTNF